MKQRAHESPRPVKGVKQALGGAQSPSPDVAEGFRGARSALGQITADLERLRGQAASLVKGAHRPAK
jgi:hypothetical protein